MSLLRLTVYTAIEAPMKKKGGSKVHKFIGSVSSFGPLYTENVSDLDHATG